MIDSEINRHLFTGDNQRPQWHGLIGCLLLVVTASIGATSNIKINSPPVWVQDVPWVKQDTVKVPSSANDYYYRYLNYQEHVALHHLFKHSTVQLLSPEGVQEMSDIMVTFDPSYQKLTFHSIAIYRKGLRIDKLRRKDIRVVQREVNMDRHLYDGRLTAIINLTDVRVGDILDWSFSLSGDNPVLKGMYENQIYLQYVLPVERFSYRLLVPPDRDLQFRYKNGADAPDKRVDKNMVAYCWERQKLQAFLYDINTPYWYDPIPSVSISEYRSWDQVIRQFSPLFTAPPGTRDALKRRLKRVVSATVSDSAIVQSIRFVQDHIRYLGLENGINSHLPTAPLKVLDQRFGDCKAKSFLLCEILKANGVEAFPVLVNTHFNSTLNTDLPSPNLFNHCIVQLAHNNKQYYVDPTINGQGGDLEHLSTPKYRYGLVLKNGNDRLNSIAFNVYDQIRVVESFTLDTVGGAAGLIVSTLCKGASADRLRSQFTSTSSESMTKQYINFYSKLYPGIRAIADLHTVDRRDPLNEFFVAEQYTIDSVWKVTDTMKKSLALELYPLSMETYVSGEQSPKRTMPYAVGYPVDYEHKTVVHLPESWPISNDTNCIQAGSFKYTKSVRYSDGQLSITHTYRTFQDHIEPGLVDDYIAKHNDIMDNLSFSLTYTPPSARANSGFMFSLPAGLIALIFLVLCGFFAFRIYLYGDVRNGPVDLEPIPIGGWLILVGIGFVVAPVRLIFDVAKTPEFFNNAIWSAMFDLSGTGRNLVIGIVMFLELVFNCAKLVFEVLCIVLFFKRRSIFPLIAIVLYLVSLVVLIGDTWLASLLNSIEPTSADTKKAYKEIIQSVVNVAIWVPYLIISNRVKETFVVRAPKQRSRINEIP